MDTLLQRSPLRARFTSYNSEDLFCLYSPLAIWRTQSFTADLVHFLGLKHGNLKRTSTRLSGPGSCLNTKPDAKTPLHSRQQNGLLSQVCSHVNQHIVATFFLRSVFFPKNAYSEFALRVAADVLERWRFQKQDKWQRLIFLFISPVLRLQHCIHSMQVKTVVSMNVAIVVLGPMFIWWEGLLVLFTF